jgi:hypothetical protein
MLELKLNVDQINMILGGLGKLPFEVVAGLVDEIRNQVMPQIEQKNKEQHAQMQPGEPE